MDDEIICQNCNNSSSPGTKFCPNCGNPFPVVNESDGNASNHESEGAADKKSDTAQSSQNEQIINPNNQKTKKKKISRKAKVAIIAGSIFVLLIIAFFTLANYGSAIPLKCNEQVTVNGVEFSYPSEWKLEEKNDDAQETVYIRPDTDGLITIQNHDLIMDFTEVELNEYLKGLNATLIGNFERYKIEEHKAVKAKVTWERGANQQYEGYLLLVSMDYSITSCLAVVKPGDYDKYLNTYETILDSARLNISKHDYKVTFEDEGDAISMETVTYQSGGIILNTPQNVKRDGYVLNGWELTDGAENVVIKTNGTTIYAYHMKGNFTLSATWESAFTVTFTDGFGEILKTETVKSGGNATAPTEPKKDGYKFAGWSNDYNNISENMTIDAKWTKIPSVSEKNALAKAKQYLDYTAFSYTGLIEQLEYEGFSNADATYGADNCGADWNAQAAKKAKQYMDYSSFSRSRLIRQLEYEGFTPEQAAYGADSVGL